MTDKMLSDLECPDCEGEHITKDDKTHQKYCTKCRQIISVKDKDKKTFHKKTNSYKH